MAATTCKLVCLLLIFVFVPQGNGECNAKNVTIVQYFIYNMIKYVPGIQARVTNTCPCEVSDIKFSCGGFKSSTTLDSSMIKQTGDVCLINNGNALLPTQQIYIDYNWWSPFNFTVISAKIGRCS
ncbi:unnamed protein product [Arabis nemorensis]|uniref:Wall-associated receptor kinase galacturonan-binding domain-containing protein n=1 Tax=Arabis nemorensis TaxID=586526 RepID=A0A565CEC2_9BRAS|nr:unnamed protein product [Arabis nemorensis]